MGARTWAPAHGGLSSHLAPTATLWYHCRKRAKRGVG
jgi:hypothetical protein